MKLRASRIGLLVIVLVLTACAAREENEITLAACTDPDGVDEDGDGVANCGDPDCYRFLACSLAGQLRSDGGGFDGEDGGTSGAGASGGMGGTSGSPSMPPIGGGNGDHDAGPSDGGSNTPSCGTCAANEVCTELGCAPVDAGSALYKLMVVSATVPIASSTTRCYDCDPVYAACGACPPDPYVIVFVVPANQPDAEGVEVGRTQVVSDSVSPTFDSELTFALRPDDMLRFELWDSDDGVDADDQLYSCLQQDLTLDAESTVDCTKLTGFVGVETHHVHATLAPVTE